MSARRILAIALAATGVLAACGADESGSPTTEPDGPSGPTVVSTTPDHGTDGTDGPDGSTDPTPADGGWLGGEPEWGSLGDADGGGERAGYDVAMAEAPSSGAADDVIGEPPVEPSTDQPALRAGSVDDNADFAGFLDYLARIDSLGIPLRSVDPSGRIVVSVTGTTGLPVSGAEVVVSAADSEVARLRTTADGTARFHPAFYGAAADEYVFAVGGASATAAPGGEVTIAAAEPGGASGAVPLDVLFLLDATGSMGDEIDRLKTSIDSIAARVDELAGAPDVRFAMTLYRDDGDAFVTATHDFTSDVAAFRAALAEVVADGGGDYPEALDEGLAEALMLPAWRDPASTVQLVFLVADAPPQVGRQVDQPYDQSIEVAIGRGVKIFPVASSDSDDQAEAVFRQLAQATGARFVFLSYGAGGAATGGSSDITSTDYEELALDDLVVRLIAEELAALTGDPGRVPPPTPTTTTVPPGQ